MFTIQALARVSLAPDQAAQLLSGSRKKRPKGSKAKKSKPAAAAGGADESANLLSFSAEGRCTLLIVSRENLAQHLQVNTTWWLRDVRLNHRSWLLFG